MVGLVRAWCHEYGHRRSNGLEGRTGLGRERMSDAGEADGDRLTGRVPRAVQRDVGVDDPVADNRVADDEADMAEGHEIDAVNRLLGFLRSDEGPA
jgi:hypothetical protein